MATVLSRIAIVGIGLPLLAVGCTHANRSLNRPEVELEDRVRNDTRAATFVPSGLVRSSTTAVSNDADAAVPPATRSRPGPAAPVDDDGYFVGIALSGGGSRSANFSAACLFQLQRIGLLQHADYVSSVSGGSLAGAYYCVAADDDWNPGTVQRKLSHSFASDIIANSLMPWTLFAFVFTDWDRSDLLASALRDGLFTRGGRPLTFADLRPDRPRLLINATDLQSGRRFVFCNETFNDLNADLGRYPIHYAVAASASFPIVFHHVTLRDYSTIFNQYRHLIDGGVTDNLGVETLLETYEGHSELARRAGRPTPYPNGAVFIVIDARTNFDVKLGDKGDLGFIESLKAGTGLTSTALLTRASSATLSEIIVHHSPDNVTAAELRQQIAQLETDGYLLLRDRDGRPVRVVHLSLSHVNRLRNLPFQSFSESVNSIATYFNISDTEVFNLYQAAKLLMQQLFEDQLRQLTADLTAATRPSR